MQSIILAAGKSSRMKTSVSKVLQPLLGKSLIRRAFELTEKISTEAPLFVAGENESELQAELDKEFAGRYKTVVQNPPRGTGDAVAVAMKKLRTLADETQIFIMGADAILLRPESLAYFVEQHFSKRAVLSFLTTELFEPRSYGRVVRSSSGAVDKIVEAKDATQEELRVREINAGFYLIQKSALEKFLAQMQQSSKTGEFYLTDMVAWAKSQSHLILGQCLADSRECLGINSMDEMAVAERILLDRLLSQRMKEGVRIHLPETQYLEESVDFETDVVIEPHCVLLGNTKLGKGTQVKAFSHLEDAELGANTIVGPFARLRPGTKLEAEVRIGNFVETKKSHFSKGSKANHLSYIGDTKVGAKANIGAGTITCNYDGYGKYPTEIGEGAFIGSNSSLVAPVEIGKAAIVAAGSVITENVPENALGIGRARQTIKEEAAQKFRSKKGVQ